MNRPTESWVAKYQSVQMMKPGIYALEVSGTMPAEVDEYLKGKGIMYRAKPA